MFGQACCLRTGYVYFAFSPVIQLSISMFSNMWKLQEPDHISILNGGIAQEHVVPGGQGILLGRLYLC